MCKRSFFFSHKVLWFINSIDFLAIQEPVLDISILIKQIEEVSRESFTLFLGNSEKIKKYLKKIGESENNAKKKENTQIMNEYRKGTYKGDVDPEYIPLSPFPNDFISDPFYSTICFLDSLRDISFSLTKSSNRLKFLRESLKLINKNLPAGIYLPFNSPYAKNCSVLHIPIAEATVFSTKDRAPFKIAIEIYCPYEELKQVKNRTIRNPGSIFSECPMSTSESLEINHEVHETPNFYSSLKPIREESHYLKAMSTVSDGLSALYNGEHVNSPNKLPESFTKQEKRVKSSSPYGGLSTWRLINIIVKSGDDLRQEQLAIQLISYFQRVFIEKKLDIWLYPYEIVATHHFCGIIECVPDAMTIDGIKKNILGEDKNLYDYFLLIGPEGSQPFKNAQREFMKSLAGYSLACFILQIKDRHNGNILIDSYGHIVHIDFGFMLSNSPGGNLNFESAPFKLTEEFERILGGRRSPLFNKFRGLCVKGFMALMERAEQIELMVEMMRDGSGGNMPCFEGEEAVQELRERLLPKEIMKKADCKKYINSKIDESLDHWSTMCYDRFQYCCQGILY